MCKTTGNNNKPIWTTHSLTCHQHFNFLMLNKYLLPFAQCWI